MTDFLFPSPFLLVLELGALKGVVASYTLIFRQPALDPRHPRTRHEPKDQIARRSSTRAAQAPLFLKDPSLSPEPDDRFLLFYLSHPSFDRLHLKLPPNKSHSRVHAYVYRESRTNNMAAAVTEHPRFFPARTDALAAEDFETASIRSAAPSYCELELHHEFACGTLGATALAVDPAPDMSKPHRQLLRQLDTT